MTINIGRDSSGGVFNGLFGNPWKEPTVNEERYRKHFKSVVKYCPDKIEWLVGQIKEGSKLYCPGCGIDCPTCHARIIEQELKALHLI